MKRPIGWLIGAVVTFLCFLALLGSIPSQARAWTLLDTAPSCPQPPPGPDCYAELPGVVVGRELVRGRHSVQYRVNVRWLGRSPGIDTVVKFQRASAFEAMVEGTLVTADVLRDKVVRVRVLLGGTFDTTVHPGYEVLTRLSGAGFLLSLASLFLVAALSIRHSVAVLALAVLTVVAVATMAQAGRGEVSTMAGLLFYLLIGLALAIATAVALGARRRRVGT